MTFKSKTKTGHIGILKQVDILQLNGKIIKTIRTSPGSLLEDSFIIKFVPPRDPFLLRFIGVDNRGDFARVSPNVADPVLPGALAYCLSLFNGFSAWFLAITCFLLFLVLRFSGVKS